MDPIDQILLQQINSLSLAEITSTLAHDIKNPLAAICYANALQQSLLEKGGAVDPEKLLRISNNIESASRQLEKMANQLRNFSRDRPIDPVVATPIKNIVFQAVALNKIRLDERNVQIHAGDISEDLQVECRPHQLVLVLSFLINNSYDALENCDEKWININAFASDNTVEINFQDSGDGVTQEIKESMLKSFYSASESGAHLGMGLNLSKRILDQHDGQLHLPDIGPKPVFKIILNKLFKQQIRN